MGCLPPPPRPRGSLGRDVLVALRASVPEVRLQIHAQSTIILHKRAEEGSIEVPIFWLLSGNPGGMYGMAPAHATLISPEF